MDHLLADETILRILGYLDAKDLVRVQQVSSHLCLLARDRLLWKRLFYFNFVRPAESTRSRHAGPAILPTLRELRSLLLHQNVLLGKHVAGDGPSQIQRLPDRFHSSSALQIDADKDLSSLYLDGVGLSDTSEGQLLDWEQIYRVSRNWQQGNFVVSELPTRRHRAASVTSRPQSSTFQPSVIRVSSDFIFAASSTPSHDGISSPIVSVYSSEPVSDHRLHGNNIRIPSDLRQKVPVATLSSPGLEKLLLAHKSHVHITEIAVDAGIVTDASDADASGPRKRKSSDDHRSSSPAARLLVAYSTGHISLFSLTNVQGTIRAVEEMFHRPAAMNSAEHVTMAALHSHALVLCSSKFDVAFYQLDAASASRMTLVYRMSSYRCSWPASLRLKKLPYFDVHKRARRTSSSPERHAPRPDLDKLAYRVTLAYSTPSYPSSWSVSVQEIVVRLDPSTPAAQISSRHATAKHPFRPTPVDLRGRSMLGRDSAPSLPAPSMHSGQSGPVPAETPSLTSSRSTSLTYDDPFVVLGASDNLIEVYELLGATTFVRPSQQDSNSTPRSATATSPSQKQVLRLVHRRKLYGHTGSVDSVALEDGRCVSGSADGSVMIWTLGDRSNETDSIASAMRTARTAARGKERSGRTRSTGARSTSSTILEEEEGDEAASQMAHVLTLRTPADSPETGMQDVGETELNTHAHIRGPSSGPSLGQIVRSRVLDRQARGIIRWVSTAFDKIVSIVAYPDATPMSTSSLDAARDASYPRERVQVWSFG